MLFSSLSFIFIFLPVFLAAYYLTPERYRNVTLLIGSLIFYAIGEPRYIVLFVFSLVLNYLLYLAMDHCRSMTNVKRQGSTIVKRPSSPSPSCSTSPCSFSSSISASCSKTYGRPRRRPGRRSRSCSP